MKTNLKMLALAAIAAVSMSFAGVSQSYADDKDVATCVGTICHIGPAKKAYQLVKSYVIDEKIVVIIGEWITGSTNGCYGADGAPHIVDGKWVDKDGNPCEQNQK